MKQKQEWIIQLKNSQQKGGLFRFCFVLYQDKKQELRICFPEYFSQTKKVNIIKELIFIFVAIYLNTSYEVGFRAFPQPPFNVSVLIMHTNDS